MVDDNEFLVLSEIHRIVTQELGWEGPVEPSQHLLGDLQLDSLGLMVLAVELENRFRIRLSPDDSARVSTVGELIHLVVRRTAETESPTACGGRTT
ncbi:MAG TPA: acyl carrier protein [Myxococcaceae bacterium]|nr:acyl carrier protein [Myxococcaceae bacterium]